MADSTISGLAAATSVGNADQLELAQSSASKSLTATLLRDYILQAQQAKGGPAQNLWQRLASDYTLTSTTSAQKLLNATTNGALTLATGVYFFSSLLYLTGMSSTSGNGQFQVLGGGTATLGNVLYYGAGIDNTTPLAVGTTTGSGSASSSGAASIVTATTGTGMIVDIHGTFGCTGAGTIIPSIALVTAAAAVVKAGSFFTCFRAGDTSTNYAGNWS